MNSCFMSSFSLWPPKFHYYTRITTEIYKSFLKGLTWFKEHDQWQRNMSSNFPRNSTSVGWQIFFFYIFGLVLVHWTEFLLNYLLLKNISTVTSSNTTSDQKSIPLYVLNICAHKPGFMREVDRWWRPVFQYWDIRAFVHPTVCIWLGARLVSCRK